MHYLKNPFGDEQAMTSGKRTASVKRTASDVWILTKSWMENDGSGGYDSNISQS